MRIAKTIKEMRELRSHISGNVGFIPTMGFLHEGHISLVKKALEENEHAIVSIFVNPKQFGPHEDFSSYPRDEKKDLQLLENAGVAVVFLPSVDEMYPDGFETSVSVEKITKKLEGAKRPGHFNGVATVVSKLFNIIQPNASYFGQKDAQQVVVMKKMVKDLQFPTKIVVGEIVREPDGLAMSSRNVYLSKTEREEATVLFQSLQLAQKKFHKGERNAENIKNAMRELIETTKGSIDYISIADHQTLSELKEAQKGALISLAVYFGKTRLIDNCILD